MLRHRISFSTPLEVSTLATPRVADLRPLLSATRPLKKETVDWGSRPRLEAVTKIVCRTPGASFNA